MPRVGIAVWRSRVVVRAQPLRGDRGVRAGIVAWGWRSGAAHAPRARGLPTWSGRAGWQRYPGFVGSPHRFGLPSARAPRSRLRVDAGWRVLAGRSSALAASAALVRDGALVGAARA